MSKARMLATRLQGRRTALGFICRIPRYSEDLDFTAERRTEGVEPNLVLLANALRQSASGVVE